ncbi:tumor necrosis factor receptor superfamily member 10B-like [Ovis aries]|uniref:tumor necrosis factor receptor superfamily member 10B-like n=1 Tax=Ovis aries TaxID=9940 RepID=UPI00295260AC|nr:tumor necrosis factor receptor superfamily member 10B-like [Ovis aries]
MPTGEEEKNRCTPTKDTECQCKPGPFRGEEAPEFCQKCSTRCPDGKVMVTDCTPWSNIKCVDQEAGTLAHGEAPVPGELGTPSPSSGTSRLVIGIVAGLGIVLIGCVIWCFFNTPNLHPVPRKGGAARGPSPPLSGCLFLLGLSDECWHKVIGFSSIWPHQTLSNSFRPTTMPRVDVVLGREADRITPSPEMQQAGCLFEPAAPEGSQRRRWLLVPTDATHSECFVPGQWIRSGGRRDTVLISISIAVRATQRGDGLSLNHQDSNSLPPPSSFSHPAPLCPLTVAPITSLSFPPPPSSLLPDAFSLCDSSLLFQMGPQPLLRAGLSADLDCPQLLWAWVSPDALCEILPVTKKGQRTSVNTLMDALEMLGQRVTKETIQEGLLNSGKY